MPLTDEQKNAIAEMRAGINARITFGTAESVDQRARLPDPAHVPADVTARVEIAPPSPQTYPLLDNIVLKAPERVPVYFYSLHTDQAESEVADTRVIFFIHGGGNIAGHPTHIPFIHLYVQLLRAVASRSADKCLIIVPSYRLSTVPENTFPAALQDVVAAYDYVIGKGYKASNILVAGDSAGGNHAVVLTHLILQSDKPSPRGVIPIAPCAIQVYDRLSEQAEANANSDLITVSTMKELARAYIGDSRIALTDPLVSGAFIPFATSWPKTLILVGTGDLLIDASSELEKRLLAVGVSAELVQYDELPHGWWTMPQIFPEFQDAVQRIAHFAVE